MHRILPDRRGGARISVYENRNKNIGMQGFIFVAICFA